MTLKEKFIAYRIIKKIKKSKYFRKEEHLKIIKNILNALNTKFNLNSILKIYFSID